MQFKELSEQVEDSNLFVKIKSGGSVKGVLQGDVYEFKNHWLGQKSEACIGHGCPHCKAGNKPKYRFRSNMVINENGKLTAKILEQGAVVAQALEDLQVAGYDLEKTVIQIGRKGEMLETTYNVVPLKDPLTPELLKKIQALKLNDLKPIKQEEEELNDSIEVTTSLNETDLPW